MASEQDNNVTYGFRVEWWEIALTFLIGLLVYFKCWKYVGLPEDSFYVHLICNSNIYFPLGIVLFLAITLCCIHFINPKISDIVAVLGLFMRRDIKAKKLKFLGAIFDDTRININYEFTLRRGQKLPEINILTHIPHNTVYAIDRSHPGDWWSNGILVYDTILRRWANKQSMEVALDFAKSHTKFINNIKIENISNRLFLIYSPPPNRTKEEGIEVNLEKNIKRLFIWKRSHFKCKIGSLIVAHQYESGVNIKLITKRGAKKLLKTIIKNPDKKAEHEIANLDTRGIDIVLRDFVVWDSPAVKELLDEINEKDLDLKSANQKVRHLPIASFDRDKTTNNGCLGYRSSGNKLFGLLPKKNISFALIDETEIEKHIEAWNILWRYATSVKKIDDGHIGKKMSLPKKIRRAKIF